MPLFFDKWLFYCSLKGLFFCTIHYFNCYFLDFLGFRLGLQYWIKKEKKYKQNFFSQLFENYDWIFYRQFRFFYLIEENRFVFYHLLLSLFVFYFLFDRNICNFSQLCRGKNQNCIGSLFSTEKLWMKGLNRSLFFSS